MTNLKRKLVSLFIMAVLLRGALLSYTAMHPQRFDFPDSQRYVTVARNIAAGNGPVQARDVLAGTDPAYPGLLAVGIFLGCESDAAIMNVGRVINAVAALVVVWLCFAIGRHFFNERVGMLAALWCALDPILLYFNALVLTELPFIALLLGSLYGLLRYRETYQTQWAWLAGALMGLGILTRSSSLLLFVPYLLLILILPAITTAERDKRRLRRPRAAILFLFGMSMVLFPTIYRNYQLFGAFVPVRTGSGASLLESLGPWADGGPGMEKIEYPSVPIDADEVRRDAVYRETAWSWARAHPSAALKLAWAKLTRTWSITMNAPGYQTGVYAVVCWLSVFPIFVLGAMGIWQQRGRWWLLAFLLAPAAYFTLVHMVFVGSVRYRLPAMPLIFILAATTLDRWLPRRDDLRSNESA